MLAVSFHAAQYAALLRPTSYELSYDHRVVDGAEAVRFTSLLGELLGDIRCCCNLTPDGAFAPCGSTGALPTRRQGVATSARTLERESKMKTPGLF